MIALRWALGCIFALCFSITTAFAQDAAPAEENTTGAAVDTIVELLSNPEVATELAQRLGGVVVEGAEDATDSAEDAPATTISIGRSIALTTSEVAMQTAETVERYWIGLSQLPRVFTRAANAVDGNLLMDVLKSLGIVIVVTYGVYLSLKFLARGLHDRIGRIATNYGFSITLLLLLGSLAIDAVIVALAAAGGYAATIYLSSDGVLDVTKSLYLNAFVVVQISKIVARAILAPRVPALRLTRLPDNAAAILSGWLVRSIMVVGYGHLLAVPIINRGVSILTGNAVGTLLSIIVVLYAIFMLLRYRKRATNYLFNEPDNRTRFRDRVGGLLWIPILLYLLGLLAVVATRPAGVLLPLLQTTGIIVAAAAIASLIVRILSDVISSGISLPDSATERFPLLEARLNGVIPRALMIIRLLVVAGVIAVVLDLTGIADISGWITSDRGLRVLGIVATVTIIVIFTLAIWIVFSSWVEYRLNPNFGSVPTARERTLLSLLRNAFAIALLAITAMIVLSELGLNIGPLIASAGVLGLAIGFGAQKMVQDVITGVFIQFENAINVGDVISVGGITGAVEKLTVRSVSIRDLHGVFHIIPFSSVDLVSNYMREFSYFVCDMGVAYREDISEGKQAMFDAFDELKASEAGMNILGEFEWFGLNTFGDSAIVLRARIKTLPGQQWGIGRAYNEIIKRLFDERGIEIPFPHQTIYFGEDKNGNAPPLHLRSASEDEAPLPEPTLVVEEVPAAGDDEDRVTDGKKAMPSPDGD
ncbi:mechanosensitive ion channel domain-containing protein [Pontivivens insulae]|uniref:Moderate conductance mechanosensitive channel YbiO n=1 Tax=Pontivivens insulae TaxID=1639689 RepID=A0A2R8AF80_9RHOB|nr:mechanosensitive ion channel domain-containing protein [Pontivivens insulae]RED11954.1 small conductance mechanosensitive channel [Pontivivens insulae]SPF30710.1 Moderate conductance mechanosensitive channel YbiO [Pontivivens insulae]